MRLDYRATREIVHEELRRLLQSQFRRSYWCIWEMQTYTRNSRSASPYQLLLSLTPGPLSLARDSLQMKPSWRTTFLPMSIFFDEEPSDKLPERWTRVFGDFKVIVERAFVFGKPGPGAGLVIHLGTSQFLAAGRGLQVRSEAVPKEVTFCGILRAAGKEVDSQDQLQTLRIWNGDETRSGEVLVMPNDEPDHGGFPIAVTIPARICVAEVEAYWVLEVEQNY